RPADRGRTVRGGETGGPPISAWSRVQPAAQYAVAIATANGAANEAAPIARLARHSRRNWGTSTSVPAMHVSTMPANDPTNESQSGIESVHTFPTATPAASSIRATDRPSSIEIVLAKRIVTARTAASASSLTAPPPGSSCRGRGISPEGGWTRASSRCPDGSRDRRRFGAAPRAASTTVRPRSAAQDTEDMFMTAQRGGGIGGITTGGIIVIVGIIVAIFWSLILGIIIALIGLIAFGGFARGRWY